MTVGAQCSLITVLISLLLAPPVFTWAHWIQSKGIHFLTSVIMWLWSGHQDVSGSAICDPQKVSLKDTSSFSVSSFFFWWLQCACSLKGSFGQRGKAVCQKWWSSKMAGTWISDSLDTLSFQSWTDYLRLLFTWDINSFLFVSLLFGVF